VFERGKKSHARDQLNYMETAYDSPRVIVPRGAGLSLASSSQKLCHLVNDGYTAGKLFVVRGRRQDINRNTCGLTHSKNCSCHNRPTEKQSKITKTSKSTQRVKFNIATDSTIQVGSEQSARNQQKQRCMQLDHMILRFVQAHHAVTIAFCT